MENKELQKIWKSAGLEQVEKDRAELDHLLSERARHTMSRFRLITVSSILSSTGLLIFLAITCLRRLGDALYLANNIVLGTITMVALISGLVSLTRIRDRSMDQPLKEWLEERIGILSKSLSGPAFLLYFVVIPVILVLTILSIHVYFEGLRFAEVMQNEESQVALIAGTLVGLTVAILTTRKLRKYQFRQLEFLKDLYKRI